MNKTLDLTELKEAEKKATPGPWSTVWNKGLGRWKHRLYDTDAGEIYSELDNCGASEEELKANDEFIALSRNLVPKMIEEIEFHRAQEKQSALFVESALADIENLRTELAKAREALGNVALRSGIEFEFIQPIIRSIDEILK